MTNIPESDPPGEFPIPRPPDDSTEGHAYVLLRTLDLWERNGADVSAGRAAWNAKYGTPSDGQSSEQDPKNDTQTD